MKNKKGNEDVQKWTWNLVEIIDTSLSEEQLSDIINQKLVNIIIQLEFNQLNVKNKDTNNCEFSQNSI